MCKFAPKIAKSYHMSVMPDVMNYKKIKAYKVKNNK